MGVGHTMLFISKTEYFKIIFLHTILVIYASTVNWERSVSNHKIYVVTAIRH